MKPFLLLTLTCVNTFAQGPLLPSAAPAPSMKTLDQIEARTAISASPRVPIAGPHFTITQPGSYYLTGNIQVTSGDGIVINSSNVTLDLNGFALISTTVANPLSGSAILLGLGASNVHIRNGNILGGTTRAAGPPVVFAAFGWFAGISDYFGIPSENLQISQINVKACRNGIYLFGKGSTLSQCTAVSNSASGIIAPGGSITSCSANSNADFGITAYQGSVSHSIATSNGSNGIFATQGCIANSSASSNGAIGIYASQGSVNSSVATSNIGSGIYALQGSVTSSIAVSNGTDGINAEGAVISDCRAMSNNTNPDSFLGVGIRWTGGKIQNSLADTAVPAIP